MVFQCVTEIRDGIMEFETRPPLDILFKRPRYAIKPKIVPFFLSFYPFSFLHLIVRTVAGLEFLPEQLQQIGYPSFVRFIYVGPAACIFWRLSVLNAMDTRMDFLHGAVETWTAEDLDGQGQPPPAGDDRGGEECEPRTASTR